MSNIAERSSERNIRDIKETSEGVKFFATRDPAHERKKSFFAEE
jgi:hypothetical protein